MGENEKVEIMESDIKKKKKHKRTKNEDMIYSEKKQKNCTSEKEMSVNVSEGTAEVPVDGEVTSEKVNDLSPESESRKPSGQDCEFEQSATQKKSKKKKRSKSRELLNDNCEVGQESKKIKDKKMKDKGDVFQSESKEVSPQISEPEQIMSERSKEKKKKKRRSNSPSNEFSDITSLTCEVTCEQSRKKKKRAEVVKNDDDDDDDDEDSSTDQINHKQEDDASNDKSKDGARKKKRKNKEISSILAKTEDCSGEDCEVPVKKKKKSKDKIKSKDKLVENKNKPDQSEEKNEAVASQWGNAEFGDTSQREKFLRLMGAYKPSTKKTSTSNYSVMAMDKKQERVLSNSLETQFHRALETRKERGLGLGYHQ